MFQKVPVQPMGVITGELSAMLGTSAPHAAQRATDSDEDEDGGGDKISIKVYLPDRTPVMLMVRPAVTPRDACRSPSSPERCRALIFGASYRGRRR